MGLENMDTGSMMGLINSGGQQGASPGGFDWAKLSPLFARLGGQANATGNEDQMRRLMMMLQMRGMGQGMGQNSPWLGGPPPQARAPQFPNMGQAMMPGRGGY